MYNFILKLIISLALTCSFVTFSQTNDPCGMGNSIVKNPSFENLNFIPNKPSQLNAAKHWNQASAHGTTDFIDLNNSKTSPKIGSVSAPPNGSNHFVGIQAYQRRRQGAHFEYLGTCLDLEDTSEYTFKAYVGAPTGNPNPYPNEEGFSAGFSGELVIMGLTNCKFPLSGRDCKEDEGFVELARIYVSIPAGKWLPQKIHTTFKTTRNIKSIIIGPSCSIVKRSYILIDDIFIAKGNLCPEDAVSSPKPPATISNGPDLEQVFEDFNRERKIRRAKKRRAKGKPYDRDLLASIETKDEDEEEVQEQPEQIVSSSDTLQPAVELPQPVEIDNVYFGFDESQLQEDELEKLALLVGEWQKNPERTIILSAYTDPKGSDEYNLELSKKRLATVKDYLIQHNVPEEAISWDFNGENYVNEDDPDWKKRTVHIALFE